LVFIIFRDADIKRHHYSNDDSCLIILCKQEGYANELEISFRFPSLADLENWEKVFAITFIDHSLRNKLGI